VERTRTQVQWENGFTEKRIPGLVLPTCAFRFQGRVLDRGRGKSQEGKGHSGVGESRGNRIKNGVKKREDTKIQASL